MGHDLCWAGLCENERRRPGIQRASAVPTSCADVMPLAYSGSRAASWLSPRRGPHTLVPVNATLPCPDWAVHSLGLEVMFWGLGLDTESPEGKPAGEVGE